MTINNFAELIAAAQAVGPKRIAVAAAGDPSILTSAAELYELGIATAHLIGDQAAIENIARREGLSLEGMTIIHEPDPKTAARQVMALIRAGEADVAVKGQIKTDQFLAAALDRTAGIREKSLLTHVGMFEIPGYDRILYISDGGVVLYPTIYQKLTIIQNAVEVAHKFGLKEPRVAILAASEAVHPKMPVSIEALALARMAEQGWVEGAIVDGPMPLDVAVRPEAGQADIVIVPGVEAGNTAAKAIQYLAHGKMAGLVVGARVPIIINSRADTPETRLYSTAMAVVLAAD